MLKIFAPAKINLHLHITGKRPDGYHFLDSLVCFTDIGDTLYFASARGFHFKMEGNFAGALTQKDTDSSPASNNTVVRAAWALANSLGRELNVSITLQKNLPPGGGIGGGSADAAACLWGLCQYWNLNLPYEHLYKLAQAIGSDVAVCLKSLPALMRGTGEIILDAPDLPEIPVVLIWPRQITPTVEVYKALKMEDFSPEAKFQKSYSDMDAVIHDLNATRNDMEYAAQKLFPAITVALESLQKDTSCKFSRMSGSGSTVYGFFNSETDAGKSAEELSRAHPEWWVRHGWLNRTARY